MVIVNHGKQGENKSVLMIIYEDAAQQRDDYNKYETAVHCVLWYYGV